MTSIGPDVVVTGKGRRPRTVAFGRKVSQALDRYVRARGQHPDAPSSWLWLGRKGRLTGTDIAQMLRRAREAGIGEIHPHLFRRTFAHQWLADGGSEGDLMRLAGWCSRTMLQHYGASAATERAIAAHRKKSPADRMSAGGCEEVHDERSAQRRTPAAATFEALVRPTGPPDARAPGLRFGDPRVIALFGALADFR